MKMETANACTEVETTDSQENSASIPGIETEHLIAILLEEIPSEINSTSSRVQGVIKRIALEVGRICEKSSRIQVSGEIRSWQISLARHRLQKCLSYYELGSKRGRVELHSSLSAIVYRYIAPSQSQLTFQARYNLIEDFLQEFYVESLKAFRREHLIDSAYTPRAQLELAEYMAFTEQYAKRRINLPKGYNQQLIVLRAQGFAKRLPAETTMDIEQAMEFAKTEEAEAQNRSPLAQQLRTKMMTTALDPAESVLRDRVFSQLVEYLESQGQSDCVNYLVLKMKDVSAPEIDAILGLTSRQRDYLQQRFKYHLEKFSFTSHWELVHEWLGSDIDQKLGMSSQQWTEFVAQLSPQYQQLLQLKQAHHSDAEIAQTLKLTSKQTQKRWTELLSMAWKIRNQPS